MTYVFTPGPQVSAPVEGTGELFPVRRIYCVGRNYAAHAVEMGHDPKREHPFFFQKNPDNLVLDGKFPYPEGSRDVHHEVELVMALSKGGRHIERDQAMNHVFGFAAGLDMTLRDVQSDLKKTGRPWEVAKAFEHSAPMGAIVPVVQSGLMESGAIDLSVNGLPRQSGDLNQLVWKLPEIICALSRHFELAAGDLIFTGTPAGVGPVQKGDHLEARIARLPTLSVEVV
ncbi:fumarylacetoacetate hydrolase family protein [Flexibacterium corallicola]|uniref:fumarylacetoacetate hydrolase family protein n=1 Tax=Flexibacterium corallicola TaxID=3037259 RepID=UPI00286EF834|nr:fumarylacetoacetate hydrolase family protein [Pseudovibrio sp. M1P-2-3]